MPGFSHLLMHKPVLDILGNSVILVFFCITITHNRDILAFFHIMAASSDSDRVLISHVSHIIYKVKEYTDWKPERNDYVMIVLLFTP